MSIESAVARVQEAHTKLLKARQAEERAQSRRDRAVRDAHTAGASYQQIADVLGVHRSYVYQICGEA
jgi:Homeodomain-like domain